MKQSSANAILFGASLLASTVSGNHLTVGPDIWTLGVGPTPDQKAIPGQTITFEWNGNHNAYIHPSGNCGEEGRILVGETSPASYTFTEDDAGKDITFSCDVGQHCENGGMILTVNVEEPDLTIDWFIPDGPGPVVPPQDAVAGQTIAFEWSGNHNAYIHPSGDCTEEGRTLLGETSPAFYTFAEDDIGKNLTFTCDVGQHCENGMFMTVAVAEPEPDLIIDANTWLIPEGPGPLPPRNAAAGQTVEFQWNGNHNVAIHPSGNCSEENAIFLGDVSPVRYTFTEDDVGEMVFACDVGQHCENGMIMTITVDEEGEPGIEAPTAAPSTAPPTVDPNSVAAVDCSNLRSAPQELQGQDFILNAVIDPINDLLIAELILNGNAWVGLGFTDNNAASMPGSDAVIGLPDDDVAQKYDLNARNDAGVVPMSPERQTLQDASIVQEDGQTILRFTKMLVEELPGENDIAQDEPVRYLFAHGSNNNLGFHARFGTVVLLANQCRLLNEAGDLLNPDEIDRSGNALVETVDPQRNLWVAHGACASVAWGILVPLAIGASMIRKVLEQKLGLPAGWWFQIHRALNTLALLLTTAAFALAVRAINESTLPEADPNHFESDPNLHRLTGLIIFILTVAQALNGILRPHAPKKPEKKEESAESSTETDNNNTQTEEPLETINLEDGAIDHPVSDVEKKSGQPDSEEKDESKKTWYRLAWEIGHRVLGFGLLGFCWWQVQDGLGLFANSFDEENLDYVFWIVASVLSGIIALVYVYQYIALK